MPGTAPNVGYAFAVIANPAIVQEDYDAIVEFKFQIRFGRFRVGVKLIQSFPGVVVQRRRNNQFRWLFAATILGGWQTIDANAKDRENFLNQFFHILRLPLVLVLIVAAFPDSIAILARRKPRRAFGEAFCQSHKNLQPRRRCLPLPESNLAQCRFGAR